MKKFLIALFAVAIFFSIVVLYSCETISGDMLKPKIVISGLVDQVFGVYEYKFDNIEETINKYRKDVFFKKTQFETNIDFYERIRERLNLTASQVLRFNTALKLNYDPEKQEFSCSIPIENKKLGTIHDDASINIIDIQRESSISKYKAQNAYGASVDVTKVYTKLFGITHNHQVSKIDITLKASKVVAQSIINNCTAVFSCYIQPSPLGEVVYRVYSSGSPSFSMPFDFNSDGYYLNTKLISITIINETTKDIYGEVLF